MIFLALALAPACWRYGSSNASNLSPRSGVANGAMDKTSVQMNDADVDFFNSSERTPAERALIAPTQPGMSQQQD